MVISTMKALLLTHIQWINDILYESYQRSDDPEFRVNVARAALANLTWHNLLSTMEEVLPQAVDAHLVEPEDGPVS